MHLSNPECWGKKKFRVYDFMHHTAYFPPNQTFIIASQKVHPNHWNQRGLKSERKKSIFHYTEKKKKMPSNQIHGRQIWKEKSKSLRNALKLLFDHLINIFFFIFFSCKCLSFFFFFEEDCKCLSWVSLDLEIYNKIKFSIRWLLFFFF